MIKEPINGFKAVALKKIKALEGEVIELYEQNAEKEHLEKLKVKLEELSEKVKELPAIPKKNNFLSLEKHFYELLKV